MLRFLCKIFKIEFEPCKGCEVHKQQLAIANEQIKFLTETLTNIVNPKTVEVAPITTNVKSQSMLFSRRRAAAEERDRLTAQTTKLSPFVAKTDDKNKIFENKVPLGQTQSVEQLERELGLEDEQGEQKNG